MKFWVKDLKVSLNRNFFYQKFEKALSNGSQFE